MKWFKHDTDANMDAKLQEVMLDYGLEGYGLYWYCIELIAQRVNGDNLTFELEHDCRIIARNTGSTPQKVEQMMKSFINLGLLNADNGHVFCLKLASRCDDFTAKAVRRNGVKPVTNQEVGVCPSLSVFVPLEEEEEVRKRSKKKKIEDTTGNNTSFINDGFDHFWKGYPKKVDKKNSFTKFKLVTKKLNDDEFTDFVNLITTDCKKRFIDTEVNFIPSAAKYLNGERWNDEIIVRSL
jgi:hypothetical protein